TELIGEEYTDYVKYVDNDIEVLKAKDLYKQVQFAFSNWILVAFYVIAMVALSFHLIHGFKSAFQTLGWDHKKYAPLVRFIGLWLFGVAIPIGFAAMPLYFFFAHLRFCAYQVRFAGRNDITDTSSYVRFESTSRATGRKMVET